ncbi:MAG: PqqD family protein, partial [Candidatus Aminicenantes bacterium]|nr:PqqD family protein [Candidatus Aminicenantes bacterium]
MRDGKIFKKNSKIVVRKIEDETILMPLYSTSEEIDCIYTLNDAAARIWELVDGKRTLGKIKKIFLDEFDVTEEELADFLKDLEE